MIAKTVYVLGAGFSKFAGYPLQSEILQRIKNFKIRRLLNADVSFDIINDFEPAWNNFIEFLSLTFPPDVSPQLEDIFTLLDQTIDNRLYFKRYSWEKLEELRNDLNKTILYTFHLALENMKTRSNEFYRSVGAYLLRQRIFPGQESDPLSIVSLNWDSLLEDSIYWVIRNIDARGKIDIDYCCFTTPLSESIPHIPSLKQKSMGVFNLKLMKLHGSANWLYCPNCNRLFTGVGGTNSVWDLYAKKRFCEICAQEHSDFQGENRSSPPPLQPFFISPTYVKKIDNHHIQMAWHNAFLELSQATRIVFIGYSFPEADYSVRTMLRRSIRHDAQILTVLTKNSKQKINTPKQFVGYLPEKRYKEFFGEDRVKFFFNGVQGYFSNLIGEQELNKRLSSLKGLLTRRLSVK